MNTLYSYPFNKMLVWALAQIIISFFNLINLINFDKKILFIYYLKIAQIVKLLIEILASPVGILVTLVLVAMQIIVYLVIIINHFIPHPP